MFQVQVVNMGFLGAEMLDLIIAIGVELDFYQVVHVSCHLLLQ